MAGRRTNLALLALLVLAFVTGLASWLAGPGLVRWIVIAHGAVGLAIVALAPWKSTIARRGLGRRRPGRGTAIAFAVLIVTSIVAALVHVKRVSSDRSERSRPWGSTSSPRWPRSPSARCMS